MDIIGIYKITSRIKSERCYIGSGININRRWRDHINILRKGTHHSIKLQNHFNKYGESDLVFIIIEPCFNEFLLIREQYYIDTLRPYFNIAKIAGSPMKGRHCSVETKQKMSESMKGKNTWSKGKSYRKGMLCSLETRLKMRDSQLGKKHSIESNEKSRLARTGLKRSVEFCIINSEMRIGKKRGKYKKHNKDIVY
jgi:group I intron endonuclease